MNIPTDIVDTSGLTCPLPLLKLKKSLRTLPPDSLIHFITTDPNSAADLPDFCRMTGYDFTDISEEEGVYRFELRLSAKE